MATNTTNLNLKKPALDDDALITDINDNMDTLDSRIGAIPSGKSVAGFLAGLEDGLAIVANGNTHAAVTSGQYVYVKNHSTLADGLYKATAAIAANGTLSSSNLTADSKGGLNDLNDQIGNNQYSTSGLTTTNCTIAAGGYHKLGKLVVVNIRVTASASNACSIYGFPTYNANVPYNIVSCSIVDIGNSAFCNSPAYLRYDGGLLFNGENGKTYAISMVYMCD